MPKQKKSAAQIEPVEPLIREIRGERVILDADLARVYGVPTSRFNEAVKRNLDRFPEDFRFRLTREQADSLRSQIAILNSGRGQHRKYLPSAFTEHGALMAANVLNSPQAVQMSVFVVRAFLKMRGALSDTKSLAKKLADLETELKGRLDVHEAAIVEVLQRVMAIIEPPRAPAESQPKRREIDFHTKPERGRDGRKR